MLLKDILKNAKETGQLISIRTDRANCDRFSVGKIISFNEDILHFKEFTSNGQEDGIESIKMEDIFGVDIDDIYLNKIILKQKYSDYFFTKSPTPSFYSDPNTEFYQILKNAMESNQLIHISFTFDMSLYGLVRDCNEEQFLFELYNRDGHYDGKSVYFVDDIEKINWDDIPNRLIDLIRRLNTKE